MSALAIPGLKDKIKVTRTLLKKITILATDSITDPEANYTDYSTLTIQLQPYEVNRFLASVLARE